MKIKGMIRPVLYSFRRCPYAMRARLAIASAGVEVELREIVLRDKAPAFLAISPSGTVPCLVVGDEVIDESLDIMWWALRQHDPEGLLDMPAQGGALIAGIDGPFKAALDRYKYSSRYVGADRDAQRDRAALSLEMLNRTLGENPWLFGAHPTLADLAILPFVRQFAFTDKVWFDGRPWPSLQRWLDPFLDSPRFLSVMTKYPKWQTGDPPTVFPPLLPHAPA